MQYWSALKVVQQAMIEMGLPKPLQITASEDVTVQQMLALLNRAGSDLVLGFPWEQLIKQHIIETVDGTAEYPMPDDWSYFIDQTQWDRTNHWPLLGPKTAQEWQWLKGGLLSSGPRLRYRVVSGKFEVWPVPSATNTPTNGSDGAFVPWDLAMEYVSSNWLQSTDLNNTYYPEVVADTDLVMFDPWVISAYLKLKYWEAKGLDTSAYTKDFVGVWEARIGKNKGAPMLTLAPRARTMLIGINNIPDGSWNVGNGNST
jgi:hypothetical protein